MRTVTVHGSFVDVALSEGENAAQHSTLRITLTSHGAECFHAPDDGESNTIAELVIVDGWEIADVMNGLAEALRMLHHDSST